MKKSNIILVCMVIMLLGMFFGCKHEVNPLNTSTLETEQIINTISPSNTASIPLKTEQPILQDVKSPGQLIKQGGGEINIGMSKTEMTAVLEKYNMTELDGYNMLFDENDKLIYLGNRSGEKGSFITDKGLAIGDPEEKIEQVHGKDYFYSVSEDFLPSEYNYEYGENIGLSISIGNGKVIRVELYLLN